MEITINQDLLIKLKDKGIFLDDFYLLYCKSKSNGFLVKYKPSPSVYTKMKDKGLLTPSGALSSQGALMVASIVTGKDMDLEKLKAKFDDWWNMYPRTDAILHYPPSARQIRPSSQKSKCWIVFCKYATEGIDPDIIIKGLKKELQFRHGESLRKKENVLKYIKGPLRSIMEQDYEFYNDIKVDGSLSKGSLLGKDIV